MNTMIGPCPGAATMAGEAMITACRVGYRAASAIDPALACEIGRAWRHADAEMVVAHLSGLALALRLRDGDDSKLAALCATRAAALSIAEGLPPT